MEELRWGLLWVVEAELDEEVEECLLVPLVIGLGRTRASDRVLLDLESVTSCRGKQVKVEK